MKEEKFKGDEGKMTYLEIKGAKEKIELMLKEKRRCEELERCLGLYELINSHLEKKLTNQSAVLIDFGDGNITEHFILGTPNSEIEFKIMNIEFLSALRDWYGKKIIELTEND
jgi:hypothetical protein